MVILEIIVEITSIEIKDIAKRNIGSRSITLAFITDANAVKSKPLKTHMLYAIRHPILLQFHLIDLVVL